MSDDDRERSLLITARARIDPLFHDVVFVSLRRYRLPDGRDADESAEVADLDDAVAILRSWLEEFSAP